MLDQLIESKSHPNENRRRGGFLFTTFTLVTAVVALAFVYSLFSYNLVMASGDELDISSLVAPLPDNPPQPLEPRPETPKSIRDKTINAAEIVRRDNILRIDEQPFTVPDKLSTTPNPQMSRPTGRFKFGDVDSGNPAAGASRNGTNTEGIGIVDGNSVENKAPAVVDKDDPPVMKKLEPRKQSQPTVVRASRILNGEAKLLVKPPYPLIAKTVHASGAVNVQVTIDENGNIISATAVSGHPLLRQVAEQAARSSKFNPTILNDQKVKVTGVIIYNFIAQ